MRLHIIAKVCTAVVFGLICLSGVTARGAGAWESLTGEALWQQAVTYEEMHQWEEMRNALTKYLKEDAPVERVMEARYRLIRACHCIASSTEDFAQFYTLLAEFERDYPSETAKIQDLRQLWTWVPVVLGDWEEGMRRMLWYLETYPGAPEALLVKRDLAEKKWQDGKRDEAIADLQAMVSENAGNPNLASAIGALAGHLRERDGHEAAAAFLEKVLADSPDLPGSSPLHFQLGAEYESLGRYADIEPHMRYVLDHDLYGGLAHDAVRTMAWAEESAGHLENGLAILEDAIQRYPTMPHFHALVYDRTLFQLKRSDWDGAIERLRSLISAHPDLPSVGDAVYLLSKVMMKAKGPVAAAAELERLVTAYPGKEPGRRALYLLPEMNMFQGDGAAAAEACRRYIREYPGTVDADTHRNQECYFLYQAGAMEEAQAVAEARIQASEKRSRQDLASAFVLSATLLGESKILESKGREAEAEKLRQDARKFFDVYLEFTEEEQITYTLGLYARWGEYGKVKDLAERYLAEHPGDNALRPWVQLHLASSLIAGSGQGASAKAAGILEEVRSRQKILSSETPVEDCLNGDSRVLPRALEQRIALAKVRGDWDKARECLVELRDGVPAMKERSRMLRRQRGLFDRLNLSFPSDLGN
jgi:tetratricopeptide (TPR) repeat protein